LEHTLIKSKPVTVKPITVKNSEGVCGIMLENLNIIRFPKYVKKGSLNLVNNATAYDFLNWEDRSQGIETPAPSWFNISLLGFAGYQDSAGDEDITWKNGFSTLIPQLTV